MRSCDVQFSNMWAFVTCYLVHCYFRILCGKLDIGTSVIDDPVSSWTFSRQLPSSSAMASSNLPHSDFAAQDDEKLDTEELLKLRQKCGRFRILVIGRANAGKTTLCQRMCNTEDPPIVRDKNGKMVCTGNSLQV